ncbi:MAG: mechanosensitive ion channel family protein [Thiobacillus sp.]
MNDLAQQFGFAFLAEPWLPKVLGVTVLVVGVNVAAYYLLRHIEKLAARSPSVWDDALIRSARMPLTLLLWVAGVAYAMQIVDRYNAEPAFEALLPVRDTLVIGSLAWFLLRLIRNVSHNILARAEAAGEGIDRTTVDALSKLGRFSVVLLAGLVILQNLGFSISGVLAFGGIGGIAVGFAAKDMLANFFGGLTIYLDRPFVVGEWIRSPDKDIEGTVEYIGWRHTRVRAFNKNPIYVPNALFTQIVVENPSRMSHRRIRETIGIRYADFGKMAAIVADVKAMLAAHPDIDAEAPLIVNFNQFGASSLDILLTAFTRTTEWTRFQALKQDVLLQVGDIILRHGAEIAFPTRTVHLEPADGAPAGT